MSPTVRRILLVIGGPLAALLIAFVVASIVLLAVGENPFFAYQVMFERAARETSIVQILNKSTTYFLAALAVAIGFRMNLFNIGVDGQYRLAALVAAAFAGAVSLPKPLHILSTILIAMAVGAIWAGIAGLLKVTRGVSEVISTIMLNAIAAGLIAWLLSTDRLAVEIQGSNNIGTPIIPESGHFPNIPTGGGELNGFIVISVLVGILFSVILTRTRFGYDLRATGRSETAAVASGISVKKMVLATMLLSGAVAGLVGMPQLLGDSYTYGLDFPAGFGFTGIAIALLGRNNPIGIAFGAILWSFLEVSGRALDFEEIPTEIVTIMQGTIVLSVVVAYELVRRFSLRQQQRAVGRETGEADPGAGAPPPTEPPPDVTEQRESLPAGQPTGGESR